MAEDIQNIQSDDFSAFDNALKKNSSKDDFSAFDNALKKKEPTNLNSLGGQLPSQDKNADFSLKPLPKKSWLQQGNDIANNSLLKNISKQASVKSQGTYQPEQEGSWGNIAQNLVDRTFETAAKIGKGAIDLARSLDPIQALTGIKLHPDLYDTEGNLTPHGKAVKDDWRNDPSGALALGLNGIKNAAQEDLKYNKLPDSYAGRSAEQILAMVPDVAATTLLPEARVAEGAGLVAKTGHLLINNFTKYLTAKGALEAIGTAKETGKTDNEALWEGVKGGAEGTKQGAELALVGYGSGIATKAAMKTLEKAGLTGTKGMVTKELVNTITDGIGYTLLQPTFDAALKGELPTKDAMLSGIAPTVVFRLKDAIKNAKTNAELNEVIKEVQAAKQGAAIANFIQATPESILHSHYSNESANELSAKSLELIKQSKETTDLNKKHDLILQAITLSKAANVKHVADVIMRNPEVIDEFANSDLPNDVKEQFVQKANELKPLLEKSKASVIVPEENVAPEVVDPNRPTKPSVIMPEENVSVETTTITPEGEVVKGEVKSTEEVKPTEVKEAPLKENEYYHATDATEILAPSDKGYKKREGANVVGEGIYFGKDKQHLTDRYGKNAIKAELDIKNPLISNNKYIVVDGREIDVQSLSKEDINFLKQKGYDAIKYEAADRAYSNFDETIVFDKSQIKIKTEVKPTEVSNENIDKYNEAKSFKKKKDIVKSQLGELSEEDNKILDNLNIEDLNKIADSNFDLQTFKDIKNAVQESSASSVLQSEQGEIGKTRSKRGGMEQGIQGETITEEGQKTQPKGVENGEEASKDVTGVTHAETNAVAEQLGLPAYEKNPETFEQWDAEATRRINEDKNTIPNLIKKLKDGIMPDAVEQRIMAKYLASLKSKIDADPTNNDAISAYKKARDLSDKIGGTEVGKALAARKPLEPVEDSIGDFMLNEMEKIGVDELTDKQKENIVKEFNEIKKAKEEAEAKLSIIENENNKLKAQKEIIKSKQKEKGQKTKEQFATERESLKESIKDKWNKASKDNTLTAVPLPYAKQLAAIAPDVAKLVRSYAAEGVTNLNEVVKKITNDVKEFIPEITEKDINALIAGEYNKKKETKNELALKVKDLKDEASLIVKLDKLLNGEEPLLERDKIKRNKNITDLRKQIADLKKESGYNDKSNLKSTANRLNKEAAELEKRMKEGDYDKEEKKIPLLSNSEIKSKFPKEFKEAQEAKDKLENLKKERQVRLLKEEYANRSKLDKVKDFSLEALNLPRTIMSSMDFSAPLRQGLLATVAHPILAAKAAKTMFEHAASQKEFDRWFTDLRESNGFKIMEKSGLYVADPHDVRLSSKEEAFMNNMAEKIPVIGKLIKGSERAYVSYLNKMRVDLFRQYAEVLESQGKTLENSPEVYKGIASWVNNATGRGGIGGLENAAPILNGAFFSPRLIASRLNVLGLSDLATGGEGFYGKLPKEVRVMAYKDILKTIGVGMSVLALAKLNGAKVEDDPRSSNFGKIVVGKKHYDVWGGFQQYIRFIAQITTGQIKQPNTGKIKELGTKHSPFGKTRADLVTSFIRGKLAPIPSATWNYLAGKTPTGEKTTLKGELESHLTPLIYSDVKEAFKDEGVKAIFTVGVPASFGVGVQTYDNKKKNR